MDQLIKYFSVLVVFSIFIITAEAQTINEDKLKSEIRDQADAEFSTVEVPEKWSDKSAVYIARQFEQRFLRPKTKYLNFISLVHERVKIQAKSALEDYSQFTVPAGGELDGTEYHFFAGFRVIKADGSSFEVPLSDGVIEERELDDDQFDNIKLAIPNLEVGDIIDYYIAEERIIYVHSKGYHIFQPSLFQLNADYPVMHQKFIFELDEDCYISLKTSNGAPEFEKRTMDDIDVYTLVAKDIDEIEEPQWFYENRQLPTVKFKVVYATGYAASFIPSLTEFDREDVSDVTKEGVKNVFYKISSDYYKSSLYSYNIKQISEISGKAAQAKELYYLLRKQERMKQTDKRILEGGSQNFGVNSAKYLQKLSYAYQKYEIPHDLIIGVPRNLGHIDDLILENEMVYMIRVNLDSGYLIGATDNYGSWNSGNYLLDGTKVYAIKYKGEFNGEIIEEDSIQVSGHESNKSITNVDLTISDDGELKAPAAITMSLLGYTKIYPQNAYMDFYEYMDEEMKHGEFKVFRPTGKKQRFAVEQKLKTHRSSFEERRQQNLVDDVDSDFGCEVEEVKDFKILQTGRFDDQPEFKYSYKADLVDAIKKLGPNYLVNIGQLIGGQVDIEKDETEREYDIYMPYARKYVHEIVIEVPEGYEVQGLDKINVSVENEFGGFVSEAYVAGNKLIVKTEKYYTSNFEEKENWPQMLDFLKVAKDYNGKSVLLKKI